MKKTIIIVVSLLATSFIFTSCKKEDTVVVEKTFTTNLKLTFDSISKCPVSNPNSITDWNTFFETSTNATTAIQNVAVNGNEVTLSGCTNLILKQNCFYRNNHLLSIVDDSSIVEVKDFAFANCFQLKSYSSFKTTKIGTQCFQGIIKFKTFIAPNITEIKQSAFDFDFNLDSINIVNVKYIREGSFANCSSLKYVLIPNATVVEDYSFINNVSLKILDIRSCVNLGGTDNLVFDGIVNQSIVVKLPITLNSNPNITDLGNSNTVTLIN